MNSSRRRALVLLVAVCTLAWLPARGDSDAALPASSATTSIPGPLRSFLRMAGISQKASPDEVLPLLAREVALKGYESITEKSGKAQAGGRSTEYLLLLQGYLKQARELEALAGSEKVIRVSNCSDAQSLLTILGYNPPKNCGPNFALQTSDPDKAFLAVDSGFPLENLEEALRSGQPFAYPFADSHVPVLFSEDDWTSMVRKAKGDRIDVVDSLLLDPAVARLYWSMSRIDSETGASLQKSPGLRKLLPYAAVIDFYGSHIFIRGGRVVVPGGEPAAAAWKNLAGASPNLPAEFVSRLLDKDEGWVAAYFDALSSVDRVQQSYFVQPARLQRFYEALRGRDLAPSPTRHSFQPDPGLFLLISRLQFDANGQPHIPGDLNVWKETVRRKSDSKIVRDWAGRAKDWNNPEQVVESMFAFSRVNSSDNPLQIFLAMNEIDRRPGEVQRLRPETIRALSQQFPRFHDQYAALTEFHGLNDASVNRFLGVAQAADRIPDHMLRADALGILQANIELWRILARQGQIPEAKLNDSWQGVISPFAKITSSAQLFDAGRASLGELLRAASGEANRSQDELIALLAGPNQASAEGQQVRQQLADKMRVVLDDQRLVSLDTLFALGDGLKQLAAGRTTAEALTPLAADLRDFEMPRPIFTTREKAETAARQLNNRHAALQPRTDLTKLLQSPGTAATAAARSRLTPFLRDTLVGLSYAYYEPPGAQMVHQNPVFVRSHDFSGEVGEAGLQSWQTPQLYDRGETTSGGAYLAGSLADLPYLLAEVEQNFIVPENIQSLIWEDLVPDLVANATVPRWWGVTENELHAVALYQRAGEELLSAAASDEKLRQMVMDILSDRMLPQRAEQIDINLRAGRATDVIAQITPVETFFLTAQFRKQFPADTDHRGPAGKELETLASRYPAEVASERLSRDFGVPHPVLTQSYVRELLVVPPPPAFLGYSSRMLAESWESNNLYWARLADEGGYSPAVLNRMIPELTRRMVEKIFATHPDDWIAMQRAMRETGDEFRSGKVAFLPSSGATPNP
jgi:hypothetical protein